MKKEDEHTKKKKQEEEFDKHFKKVADKIAVQLKKVTFKHWRHDRVRVKCSQWSHAYEPPYSKTVTVWDSPKYFG